MGVRRPGNKEQGEGRRNKTNDQNKIKRGKANLELGNINAKTIFANSIPVMQEEDDRHHYCLPDQLTVKFRDDVALNQAEGILEGFGLGILKLDSTTGRFTVSLPKDKRLLEWISVLGKVDNIKSIEPIERVGK